MNTLVAFPNTQISAPPASGLEAAVGNTPLLPLRRIGAHLPERVKLFAKAEWFNPSGSVKDRAALFILRHALDTGELSPGKRLLDSTSGNMGIAYATLCAGLDIPVTLALPSNASAERIAILRALGAELILTDPLEGSDGATRVAKEMAGRDPGLYFYANQYDNPASWWAHYHTTGPEIALQTGYAASHFVAGLGTSGTLTGAARYLREQNPGVSIIAVQPEAPFHGLEGLKHMDSSSKPGIFDPSLVDQTYPVPTEEAYQMVMQLARLEGLFVGISAGAAAAAALQVAEELQEGIVVTVFPDAGYKYLSSRGLWETKNDARDQ
ncbi:MAG: cysteine synthase family protein [Anaerolineales bacterium]|jgi:S-sulfo-L-cysteine synthase (O-acetyl-L-serine-dependent)